MPKFPWLKNYEKEVPATLSYPRISLARFLSDSAERYPRHDASVFLGAHMTFGELNTLANQFAAALPTLGISTGDRVALMLPNCPQILITYYGTLKARAVVVQINPLLSEEEVAHQVRDSGATTLVTIPRFEPVCAPLLKAGALKHLVLTDIGDYAPPLLRLVIPLISKIKGEVTMHSGPGLLRLKDLLANRPTSAPSREAGPDDLALIQYTGGTTGVSKGAMLTHMNLVSNTVQCRAWLHDLHEGPGGDVFLGVVPFFHVYGMTTCMNLAMMAGCTIVMLPRFEVPKVLAAARKYKCTIFSGVNLMYSALNESEGAKKGDLASVRACISGAGPLYQEVQQKFESFSGGRVVEGYGLTESSPVATANPMFGKRKIGFIGVPFPDTEVKVMDSNTGKRRMPVGKVGEIAIKGPQVMKGYWKRPVETKQALRDGWLFTGDLATMDSDGFFKMAERKKDMIKFRGENVYPRRIEEALLQHPNVADCVVVGLVDKVSGERVKAFLVARGAQVSTADLIVFCKKKLSKFEIPQEFEYRESLPKNIIGKTLRRVLREEEEKKNG